jgi:hypothetical protein
MCKKINAALDSIDVSKFEDVNVSCVLMEEKKIVRILVHAFFPKMNVTFIMNI